MNIIIIIIIRTTSVFVSAITLPLILGKVGNESGIENGVPWKP